MRELNSCPVFVNGVYVNPKIMNRHIAFHSVANSTTGNAVLGTTLTFTTIGGAVPTKRDLYLRVGARTAQTVDGLRAFNYNEPKKITIP